MKVYVGMIRKRIAILSVYASTEKQPVQLTKLFENLEAVIEIIKDKRKKMLFGDFNACVRKKMLRKFGENQIHDNGNTLQTYVLSTKRE